MGQTLKAGGTCESGNNAFNANQYGSGTPTPSIVTTPAPPDPRNTYCAKFSWKDIFLTKYVALSATEWTTLYLRIRPDDLPEPGDGDNDIASVSTAGGHHLELRRKEVGTFTVVSAAGVEQGYWTLAVDQWHEIAIKFKIANSSNFYVYHDGALVDSGSGDFDDGDGPSACQVRLSHTAANARHNYFALSPLLYSDDGAAFDTYPVAINKHLVLKAFNWSQASATADFGSALDAGTWDNIKDVPEDSTTKGTYTQAGVRSGGVTAWDGSYPGPRNNVDVTGTIRGMLCAWVASRGTGFGGSQQLVGKYGGTPFNQLFTDNTTDTPATVNLTTTAKQYQHYVDAADPYCPLIDEWLELGFRKNREAPLVHYDLHVHDMYGCLVIEETRRRRTYPFVV